MTTRPWQQVLWAGCALTATGGLAGLAGAGDWYAYLIACGAAAGILASLRDHPGHRP